MWQEALTGIVLLASLIYLVRRFRGKSCCDEGCSETNPTTPPAFEV